MPKKYIKTFNRFLGRWWNGDQQRNDLSKISCLDLEYSNVRKRRRAVGPHKPGRIQRIEAHGESKQKRRLSDGSLSLSTDSLCGWGSSKLWHVVTTGNPRDLHRENTSGKEHKMQWTSVADELFRFRHLIGEDNWLGANLERGQLSSELTPAGST